MANSRFTPGIGGLSLRLLTFDPGLRGTRLASRATASVALAVLLTHAVSTWAGQPGTQAMIAGALAMLATLAINDADRRAQMITMAWAPLPAALSLTLAVGIARWPGALHVALVGVIFLAVWVRRFGPRGFAFGMLGFITYFFALFLRPEPGSLPWFYVSIVLGLGCAALLRFVVLAERPDRVVPRMLHSFLALADKVLAGAEDTVGRGEPGAGPQRRLRRRLMQLNATALEVEALVETLDDSNRDALDMTPFNLFELELAVEQVAIEAPRMPAEKRRPARRSLRILRRCLRGRFTPPDNVLDGIADGASSPSDGGLWGLRAVIAQVFGAESRHTDIPRLTERTAPARQTGEASGGKTGPHRPGLAWLAERWRRLLADPVARQAIQASVAGSIAIAAGLTVSPQHGYWAAVTAFIVFTGTESRGEVLLKGGQRMLGTLGGVAAGVALAALVHDRPPLQIGIIFACIFIGAFFLRRSYAVMMFSITILVAMLYSLLGFFSAELLQLRLVETVIGALVGMAVAAVLLPTSTRRRVRDAGVEVLLALADLIETCGAPAAAGRRRDDLTRQSRQVDRHAQALRKAAQPLLRTTTGLLSRKGARRWLRALWVCRHYARTLVRLSRDPAWFASPEWTQATAQVAGKFRLLAGKTPPDGDIDPAQPAAMPDLRAGGEAGRDANAEGITALQRLDRIAIRLLHTQQPFARARASGP